MKRMKIFLMCFVMLLNMSWNLQVEATGFVPRFSMSNTDCQSLYWRSGTYGTSNGFPRNWSDGYSGGNCTWYAFGRAWELLGTLPKLCTYNAGKWYNYNINNGFYSYGSTPKLGAIACWDKFDSNNGHVAVVEEIGDGYIKCSESGWSYTDGYFKVRTRYLDDPDLGMGDNYRFLGYIYIGDFSAITQPPTNPTLSINKGDNGTYIIGESATFNFEVDSDVQLHLYIYKDGTPYFEGEFNSKETYTRQFYQTGHYSCYAVVHYTSGNIETGWIGWNVVESSNFELPMIEIDKGDNGIYAKGESITFNFDIEDDVQLHLYIYNKDGVYFEGEFNSKQTYTRQIYETGHYSCFAIIHFPSGDIETGWVGWNVNPIYTVSFESDQAVISDTKDVVYGLSYGELPKLQKDGYLFLGWYTHDVGGTKITEETVVVATDSHTLYAHWQNLSPCINVTVKKSGESYLVEVVPSNNEYSNEIIIAMYKLGKLVSIYVGECTENTIAFSTLDDIDKIKIMAWNSLSYPKPLCETEIVNSSEFISE